MSRIIISLCLLTHHAFKYFHSEPEEEEGPEEEEPIVCYVEEQETPSDYKKGR